MFEPNSFLYSVDDGTGVATITLNRPDRLNALTFEVYDELRRAFYALHDEEGVRVVILTGSGRGFCSGGDVEDIIGRLFEPYFTTKDKGTGLGLAIIRKIVLDHGGDIHIHNREDADGARVEIELPRHQPSNPQEEPQGESA